MDIYGKQTHVERKLHGERIIQRCDKTGKGLHRERLNLTGRDNMEGKTTWEETTQREGTEWAGTI